METSASTTEKEYEISMPDGKGELLTSEERSMISPTPEERKQGEERARQWGIIARNLQESGRELSSLFS